MVSFLISRPFAHRYLGKSGQCVVDETEKGWYIAWVDRDPAALARQAAMDKKRKHEMDDEERARRELKRQVKAAGGVKEVQADAVDLSKARQARARGSREASHSSTEAIGGVPERLP